MTSNCSQNINIPNQQIKIIISSAYKCAATRSVLKYQWVIFAVLSTLILSTLNCQQFTSIKVVIYCILFLLQETLKQSYRLLEIEDPLSLNWERIYIKKIIFIIQINMIYLIFRILIENHNIYSFLLFLHYSVKSMITFDKQNKKGYEICLIDNQQNQNILWKILTPFLLFVFTIVINNNRFQISFIQLILVIFNLILTIEVKMLLINKECHIFGWEKHIFEDNNHLIFNKQHAIKKIIFTISAAVALQNLFFILPKINQYTSFTMFHTLLLGAYTLYIKIKQNIHIT